MALTVHFWSAFNKRVNSTEIPTTTGTVYNNVLLKDNCSEHDPVLKMSASNASYTYAWIEDFGKYYFVRDVVFAANNYLEYYLTEDVLATYRGAIDLSYFRIMYSSTLAVQDKFIIDSRMQVDSNNVKTVIYANDIPIFTTSTDRYILSVYSTEASDSIVKNYVLDAEDLGDLAKWLTDPSIIDALGRYINGEPLPLIVSCRWIPYYYEIASNYDICGSPIPLKIGDSRVYNSDGDMSARFIKGFPIKVLHFEVDLPAPTSFLDYHPYTMMQLYLPGVGPVEINPADYGYNNRIYIYMCLEVVTGNVRYILYDRIGNQDVPASPIQSFDTNLSASIPLAQNSRDVPGMVSGVTSTLAGVATLAAGIAATVATEGAASPMIVSGAMATIGGVANTALSAMKHSPSGSGFYATRLFDIDKNISLIVTKVNHENPYDSYYNALYGAPASGVHLMSDLSGYVKCVDASILCNANAREKQEINDFLNGGFYLDRS